MENHHRIVHIRISLGSKVQLQQTILILWKKFARKKVFSDKNGESEHHNSILHTLSVKNSSLKSDEFLPW